MCGIAGFQNKNIKRREHVIGSMLDIIIHRGPDGRGVEHMGDVTFGHVRLAIIDIEHGKQPVKSNDGRYMLVFNGEIYNYLELRQELAGKGYIFHTFSDSEVLLYMYIEYGKEVVNHINGMFAFAVYDNKEKTLFLARDHFGIKPLYYFNNKNSFVFASEIKSILKYPDIKADVDMGSLHEYTVFQFVLNEHTLFKNIFKVEPATYLIIKNGKITEKREYWNLIYNIDDRKNGDEYAEELLLLLENSVSIQLRSDVPIGSYLSGGIDSSTISVLASKNYSGKIKTFSAGFRDFPMYDETRYAKVVSKSIESDHFEIFPDSKDFINNFKKMIHHMDEPCAGPGLFPQYMVSRLAAQHVKVILGGQGGDEIFGGYARYVIAYLEQCFKGAIFETQEEGKHVVTLQSIIPNLPLIKQYMPLIKTQFSSGLFDNMGKRYFKLVDRSQGAELVYSKEFWDPKNKDRIFVKFDKIFNKADTKSYFNKMTYFDIKTILPSLLHVEDRVGMAVSLETRVPFLDKRIVELVAKMPPTVKFKGGKTKAILLRAVKNILPREILSRKDKMGFPTPFNEWCRGRLRKYVKDILLDRSAKKRGVYNTGNIEKLIDSEKTFGRTLWGLVCLEEWFKNYIDI